MSGRLRVVRKNGDNSYCGPAALSIITGKPVPEVTKLLREVSGRERIKGCYNSWLQFATARMGYQMQPCMLPVKAPTVARWLRLTKEQRSADRTFLLNVTDHYIVVRGRKIADNHNPEGVFLRQYQHRRKRVVRVWQILEPQG